MSQAMSRPVNVETGSQRPMKVLWLIKGLGPGGAERLLTMLAEVKDGRSFAYEVAYLLRAKSDLVMELQSRGVAVHCLDGGREWNLGWARRLRRLLTARRFDVLHLHSPYVAGVARLVVRSLPRNRRPAVISTEHVPWSGYAMPTRLLNAATFRLDDEHIAVSPAVASSIPGHLRAHTRVVEHGIFVDRVRILRGDRDDVRAELGVGPDEVLITTVANLRRQKGYPALLRAARLVLESRPNVRFAAVGQGPLEGELRRLHEDLGLGRRFRFLGYREDAARVVAGSDLFVLTSLYEGLPLALMEALALRVPVVATDVAGIRDAVQDGHDAMLVPPGRPAELASALLRVLGNAELRDRLAERGAAEVHRFDIRRAAEQIEGTYREIAGPERQRWVS
jgi:glycosyltransferase involved in cell wall biosynthesis